MKTNRHSTLLKKSVHLITYNSSHKLICLLSCLLLYSMNTYAQNYVSGTVKDNNGEPLLGVSIKVKDGWRRDREERNHICKLNDIPHPVS